MIHERQTRKQQSLPVCDAPETKKKKKVLDLEYNPCGPFYFVWTIFPYQEGFHYNPISTNYVAYWSLYKGRFNLLSLRIQEYWQVLKYVQVFVNNKWRVGLNENKEVFCLHSTTNNNAASPNQIRLFGRAWREPTRTLYNIMSQFTWLNQEKQASMKQSPRKSFARANRAGGPGELQQAYFWVNNIFGLFLQISTRQSRYQLG